MDRRDRLVVVGRPVELGHAHAAEALARDGEALPAEGNCLHQCAPTGDEPTGARSVSSGVVNPPASSSRSIRDSSEGWVFQSPAKCWCERWFVGDSM